MCVSVLSISVSVCVCKRAYVSVFLSVCLCENPYFCLSDPLCLCMLACVFVFVSESVLYSFLCLCSIFVCWFVVVGFCCLDFFLGGGGWGGGGCRCVWVHVLGLNI